MIRPGAKVPVDAEVVDSAFPAYVGKTPVFVAGPRALAEISEPRLTAREVGAVPGVAIDAAGFRDHVARVTGCADVRAHEARRRPELRRGGLADPVAEALVAAVGGNALALVEAPAELVVARCGRYPSKVGRDWLTRILDGEHDDLASRLLHGAIGALDRLGCHQPPSHLRGGLAQRDVDLLDVLAVVARRAGSVPGRDFRRRRHPDPDQRDAPAR